MTDSELRAAISAFKWFHAMELRPGIVTPGSKTSDLLAAEAAALFDPLRLDGRSVLDIGAWNGFFSFEAKRRGAERVVASDSFTWDHPSYRGREALELARGELGLAVETLPVDVMRINRKTHGVFDVVLLLGVFYHLIDPIAPLMRLRNMALEALVIETHQDLTTLDRTAMVFYPGATLANDPTNWWGPNPLLLDELLREFGFARVLYRAHPRHPRTRGIVHAFKERDPAIAMPDGHDGWLELSRPADRARLAEMVRGG
jgi:tRNA (mo5U34)-methyltransferase